MIRIFLLWLALCSSALAQVPMTGAGLAKPTASGALSCSYTPVTTGTISVAYTGATPSASGGTPAYTFSETGSLPGGLTISSSTGVISGTPTASGTFPSIQVKVTDSTSTVVNCGSAFTLTISAGATLAFDTKASKASTASSATLALTGMSTTQSNDVIVCAIHSLDSTAPVMSGFAGASLTWTRLGTAQTSSVLTIGNGNAAQSLDVFWAVAATTITSQTLTATWTGSMNAATIVCVSFSGANTASPFDPNASLPKKTNNGTTTPSAPTATAVSTTNSVTAFIAFAGTQDANAQTVGSGFTLDFASVNGNSFTNEGFALEHKLNATAQSSVTVPFVVSNADWLMQVIAVTQ